MPYDAEKSGDVKKVIEKLKKTYKNVSETAARQAIHVLNSVMDSTGDEGKAWASVYSKLNERGLSKNAAGNTDAQLRAVGRHTKSVDPDQVQYAKEQGYGTGDLALGKYTYSIYGDDEERWEELLDAARAPGRSKNAGVKHDPLLDNNPYYDLKVGGFELQISPLTQADEDWERTRDGGVRIDMGKNGRGGHTLLTKQEFALLLTEWEKAAALVKQVHSTPRTASSQERSIAQRVASRYALAGTNKKD